MALLSNINLSFACKTRLCLIVPGRQEKDIFAQESFYLQGKLDEINEQDTSFLDCKHKHMMKSGAPPSESCTVWLPIEFHGFTSRFNSKGYHSLVLGFISIFLETVWVPLTGFALYSENWKSSGPPVQKNGGPGHRLGVLHLI